MAASFDLVVLGAGSGGYACALRAAQLGFTVALVEKDKVGGTCLHRGCIPTKAMLHAAEVADSVRMGSQFGVHAAIDKIDLGGVVSYADSVVARIYKGLTGLVRSPSITVVQGAGRLTQHDGHQGVAVDHDEGLVADIALHYQCSPGRDLDLIGQGRDLGQVTLRALGEQRNGGEMFDEVVGHGRG